MAAGAARKSFLLLHGTGGSGPGHWQSFLAQTLRSSGANVYYPDLPSKDSPDLTEWRRELDSTLASAGDHSKLTVVCHSLGCALWMHHAHGNAQSLRDDCSPAYINPVDRLVLVAPAGQSLSSSSTLPMRLPSTLSSSSTPLLQAQVF